MQSLLHNITTYLLTQSTHILLLFIALALLCLALKNKSAHLRYLLWLLLIAKCLLPSMITIPLAVLPEKEIASAEPAPPTVEYTFPPVEIPYTDTPLLPAPDIAAPAPTPEPTLADRLAQIPPKTYFASFWLIGLALFLLITAARAISLNLRFRRKRIPLTARLADETNEILNKFGYLNPPVYLLPGIGQPFVWGLIRGSIYLPADFTKTTTTSRRRAILAHELAHVRRFDALVNSLQILAQTIFFFHPFVWLANRLIRAEREKACDETAIAKLAASPKDYSSAIVDTLIAEYKSTMPIPSLAVAGPVKNIEDRIKTVMTPGKKFYSRPTFIALAAILLLAAVIGPTTIALTTRKSKIEDFVNLQDSQKRGRAAEELAERIDKEEITKISAGKVLGVIAGRIKKHPKTADRDRKFTSNPKIYWEEIRLGFELIVNDKAEKEQVADFLKALELVGCTYGVEHEGVFRLFGQLHMPRKDVVVNYKLRTLSKDGKNAEIELFDVFSTGPGNLGWGRETANKLDPEKSLGLQLHVTWYQIPHDFAETLPSMEDFRVKDDALKQFVRGTSPKKLCGYTQKLELSHNSNWEGIFGVDSSNNTKEASIPDVQVDKEQGRDSTHQSLGEDPNHEMTLTLGWNGEKVKIPGPIILPSSILESNTFKLWTKGKGTSGTLTLIDDENYKYVFRPYGFKKDAETGLEELVYNVYRYVPNGVLEADTAYADSVKIASEWATYHTNGTAAIRVIYHWTQKKERDCVKKVNFYDLEGNKTKEWHVSEFDVVYAEMLIDTDGKSHFTHSLEDLIHSPYPRTFTTTLPNGVTVEMVGVCKYPSEGKQWWAPDGTQLDYKIKTLDRSNYISDDPGYELAFKKTGSGSFNIDSIKGSNIKSGLQVPETSDLIAYRAHIKKGYKKTDIKIAAPSGNWKTAVISKGNASVSGEIKGKTIILAHAQQSGEDIIISCSDMVGYNDATRIIAVDSYGKELTGQTKTDTAVDNLRQRTIRFTDLNLSDAVEFNFQTCPYDYYTFKNVSLKPGKKTNVQIVQSTPTDHQPEKPVQSMPPQNITFKKNMYLTDALQFLSQYYKKNIIPSPAVVKARDRLAITNLYDVTSLEEALDAILGSHKYVIEDNFIRIYTQQEYNDLPAESKIELIVSNISADKAALIKDCVFNVFNALFRFDSEVIEQHLYFPDDNVRLKYMELFKQEADERGTISDPHHIQVIRIQPKGPGRYEVFMLYKADKADKYQYRSFEVFASPTGFKLDINVAQTLKKYEFSYSELKKIELEKWTNANSTQLDNLIAELIQQQQRKLKAAEFAKQKQLRLKFSLNESSLKEKLNKLQTTSPEKLRQEFIEELTAELGGFKPDINQNTKTKDSVNQKAIEKDKFGPVDFETYFPESPSGAQALEQLWNNPDKDLQPTDQILETVRKGLRLYKGPGNILRWIGNLFIWGEDPQNQKAIELMYHASGSPDRNLYGDAIYFGLSVTNDKTPEILNAMAAVAMKTDDYYNVTGRILWGCRNQKNELIACLDLYLKSEDESIRQKARDVKDYLTDSKAFMAKRAEEHKESVKTEYADKLPQLKNDLLNGDSQTRLDTLKLLQGKGIMTIIDDSFLDAFEACTKDSDANVRSTAARMMGNKFVWGADPQNARAIEILLPLLDDPDRSARGTAVYFGLSTVRTPDAELIEKLLLTILDDREINYYGRVIGCLRRNSQASTETLQEWMELSDTNSQRAIKAYEIYEDVLAQPLPEEYADRFAGRKSDTHEALVAMCLSDEPVKAEELKIQFIKALADSNLTQKVLDLYIIQNRETAVAMFTCDNLADRNALREALISGPGFKVAGYFHGRIGPTGSGWLQSLSRFREHNKPNRINLPDTKAEDESAALPTKLPVIIQTPEGAPAAGAQVALVTRQLGVLIQDGSLQPQTHVSAQNASIHNTDNIGQAGLDIPPIETFAVIAAHETGFAVAENVDPAQPLSIKLQPWGRVEGTLTPGRSIGRKPIWLSMIPNHTWLTYNRQCRYETTASDDGKFTFEKVPPGWVEIGYFIRITKGSISSLTSRTPLEIKPGQTAEVTLAGEGRPVVGKFVLPPGPTGFEKPLPVDYGSRFFTTARIPLPYPPDYKQMPEYQRRQWYDKWRKSPEYKIHQQKSIESFKDPNYRQYAFYINNDGSFRIEDVIPGTYDVSVTFSDDPSSYDDAAYFSEQITIPDEDTDQPFDLGTLEVTIPPPPPVPNLDNPRDPVIFLLEAVSIGRYDRTEQLAFPAYKDAMTKQLPDLRLPVGSQKMEIAQTYEDSNTALVITNSLQAKNRKGPLVFTLIKQDSKWLIRDIDLQDSDENLKAQIDQFLSQNPTAKKTYPNTKTETSSGEDNKQKIEIGGIVLDENNQAIPNVTVKVTWDVVMGMVMLDTETAQTDVDGRWSCSVPSNVNHFSIGLQHPKHYSSEFTYEPPVEKLKDKTSVLVMIRGLEISGKVVDRNGNPVSNALLMPPRSVVSISAKNGLVESPATTRTEQDGTFNLAGLKKQKQKIVVDAEGFSPAIFEFDPEKDYSDNIIISLPEPTALKGIVRDNKGNPMPNVRLETDNWEVKRPEYELKGEKYCSEYEQYIIFRRKTTTDEKGQFALSSLPSFGRLELIIVPKDQDGFLLCDAYSELPSEKIVEFTLYPVPVLSGKVIDKETRQPIKDISITTGLQWKPEDKISWRVRSHESHSEDGTFQASVTHFITSEPSNSFALRIVADGYLPYVTPSIRVDQKPESMLVTLQKADNITGFFLSPNGEPIAEMEVAWAGPDKKVFIKDYEFQKDFAYIPEYFIKTDKDGTFKLPPSQEDWTIVALHKTGYFILTSDTYKPSAEYRLILWATVKGSVWKNPSDITVPKMSLFQLIDMRKKILWDFYISTNLDGSFKYDYVPSIPLRPQWNHKSDSGSYDPVTFNQGTDYSVNITENDWQWNPIPKKYNDTTPNQPNQNTKTEPRHPPTPATLKLKKLARACFLFAEDNDGNLPENILQLKPYLFSDTFNWITDNAQYLPKGNLKDIQQTETTPLAYDKIFLRQYNGTTVAFADGHVEYISNLDKLTELGIPSKQIAIEARLILMDEDFLEDTGIDIIKLCLADDPNENEKIDSQASVSAGTPNNQKKSNVDISAKFLDDLQVKFLIRASQKYNNAKTLTAPKFMALDGETTDLTLKKTEQYTSGFSDTDEPQVDSLDTGISIKIKPNILPGDEQKVKLDIDCTITNVTGYQEQTDNSNRTYKIPILEKININTESTIPDQSTLVIIGPKVSPSIPEDKVFAPVKNSQRLLLLIKPTIINNQ